MSMQKRPAMRSRPLTSQPTPVMRPRDKMIEFAQDGTIRRTSGTFYRGETVNYHPHDGSLDRDDAVVEYIVKGLMPAEPMIGPETVTVAFGSCFAIHISTHLSNLGFNVSTRNKSKAYISVMGDGIVNSYAVRQQFEWAWEGRVPEVPLWHGYDGREFGYDETVRRQTRQIFDAAEVFILTLGLSEIWYDEPTGEVFWRAVPADRIDPSRHKFRNTTTAENVANLEAIHGLIRRHRPDAAIVFTLSPVALTATFRGVPCLVANAASKAVLRSALDEFMGRHVDDRRLFYFPSYEVVTTCFQRPFVADRRHPHWTAIDFNLTLFERYFCKTGLTDEDVLAVWRLIREEDRHLAAMSSEEAQAVYKARVELRLEEIEAMRQRARAAAEIRRAAWRAKREKAERQASLAQRKAAWRERQAVWRERKAKAQAWRELRDARRSLRTARRAQAGTSAPKP